MGALAPATARRGAEALAVDRRIDDGGRRDTVVPACGEEGRCPQWPQQSDISLTRALLHRGLQGDQHAEGDKGNAAQSRETGRFSQKNISSERG
jgi:hypothetical protein